jgi:hypothetical protein
MTIGTLRGYGPVRQLAFVVDDVVAEARRWAELFGAGPFMWSEAHIPDTVYRGQPVAIRAVMGIGMLDDQQIELIQPIDATPSVYREFLDAKGPGLHHVCFWDDVDAAVGRMQRDGFTLVHHGLTVNGDAFAYLSGPCAVPYVEVVDPEGGSGSMARMFAGLREMADGWDGSDPVRKRG